MSNSWRRLGRRYHIPVTAAASERPVSLHLPHKKHETPHCLTSAPAWRGDACLICWGRPANQDFPHADKAINRRGDDGGGRGGGMGDK